MGTLYLVATPIGNLEDITARALRVLQEVHLIAAEDTRRTGQLLAHFAIETKLTSYYEFNKLTKVGLILQTLELGQDVALVSDAGTPGLNDPGYELVRAALEVGFTVSPIPGPSAPIAALVASGLPTDAFLYLGYLPRKSKERQQSLERVHELPYTLIFLEAPHRLTASLDDLSAVLGDRKAVAARELTKMYEEFKRGTLLELKEYFSQNVPRGEFTLIVAGQTAAAEKWSEEQVLMALQKALGADETPSQIASRVAQESGWPRRQVYQMYAQLQKG